MIEVMVLVIPCKDTQVSTMMYVQLDTITNSGLYLTTMNSLHLYKATIMSVNLMSVTLY